MYTIQFFFALELTMSIYVLYMFELGLNMTQTMILEMVFMFIIVLLEVPSGAFADLWGRKTSLIIAGFTLPLGFLLVGLAEGFILLLIAQFVIAIAWSFTSGAEEALLYDSLKAGKKEKEFKRIFGIFNFVRQFAWTIVAVISGLLASYFAYKDLFFATAISYVPALIFMFMLREPPQEKHIVEKNYYDHLKTAVRFSITHANVRFYILYFSMFAAISHLTWFLLQPYFKNMGTSVFFIGIAVGVYFFTYALGSILSDKISAYFTEKSILLGTILIASLSFIALYFTQAWLGLSLIAIMSFVCGIREVVVSDGINKHTDSHHRATVLSVRSLAKGMMYVFFAFIIGRATDIHSPGFAFLLMGIGLAVFTILLFSGRYVRHMSKQKE